jgi:hypothetical protein
MGTHTADAVSQELPWVVTAACRHRPLGRQPDLGNACFQ